jgi:predicted nucleotidyltransferase
MQNITDDLVAVTGIGPVIDELNAREEVLAIILFGSVARGRARPFSDIDLCVVTRNDLPEQERLDLQSYGSRTIEVSIFHDLPLPVRFRVIREGKLVLCKDRLAFHRVVVDTVRNYLDNSPRIRRQSERALGIVQ